MVLELFQPLDPNFQAVSPRLCHQVQVLKPASPEARPRPRKDSAELGPYWGHVLQVVTQKSKFWVEKPSMNADT